MDTSGQPAIRPQRKDTHIPIQAYGENGWEGHSPAYLLDSLDHFLDVGAIDFSLEPVDRIGVLLK